MVFPAWAGMNRTRGRGTGGVNRVPRVGGDEPHVDEKQQLNVPCSPRGRG